MVEATTSDANDNRGRVLGPAIGVPVGIAVVALLAVAAFLAARSRKGSSDGAQDKGQFGSSAPEGALPIYAAPAPGAPGDGADSKARSMQPVGATVVVVQASVPGAYPPAGQEQVVAGAQNKSESKVQQPQQLPSTTTPGSAKPAERAQAGGATPSTPPRPAPHTDGVTSPDPMALATPGQSPAGKLGAAEDEFTTPQKAPGTPDLDQAPPPSPYAAELNELLGRLSKDLFVDVATAAKVSWAVGHMMAWLLRWPCQLCLHLHLFELAMVARGPGRSVVNLLV